MVENYSGQCHDSPSPPDNNDDLGALAKRSEDERRKTCLELGANSLSCLQIAVAPLRFQIQLSLATFMLIIRRSLLRGPSIHDDRT